MIAVFALRISPQAAAMLRLDLNLAGRGLLANALIVAFLLGVTFAMPLLFPDLFGSVDAGTGGGRFVAAAWGAIAASCMLGSFSGLGLPTRTRPLLISVPLPPRAVWEIFVGRAVIAGGIVTVATLYVLVTLPVHMITPGSASGLLVLVNCVLGGVLLLVAAKYAALCTAGAARGLRWALWGALAAFATGPFTVLMFTGDSNSAALFAGPGFAVMEVGRVAAAAGPLASLAFAAAVMSACIAFAAAPLTAGALQPRHPFPQEGIKMPFPVGPLEEQYGASIETISSETGRRDAGVQMTVRFQLSLIGVPMDNDFEPLKLPERRADALRFLGREPLKRADVVALSVGLAAIAALLVVGVWLISNPMAGGGGGGVPAMPDPLGLLSGLVLFFVAIVALATSPGFSTREQAKMKARRDGQNKPTRRPSTWWGPPRVRPMPSVIRRWPFLQSLPVDRAEMVRAFFPRQKELLATLAASATVVGAAYAAFRPDPVGIAVVLAFALSFLAFLAFVGVAALLTAYVPRRNTGGWFALRLGIVVIWMIAGTALLLLAMGAVLRLWSGLPLGTRDIVAVAAAVAIGVPQPWIAWRAGALKIVTSQRPYETTTVLIMASAGGAAALIAAVYAMLPL